MRSYLHSATKAMQAERHKLHNIPSAYTVQTLELLTIGVWKILKVKTKICQFEAFWGQIWTNVATKTHDEYHFCTFNLHSHIDHLNFHRKKYACWFFSMIFDFHFRENPHFPNEFQALTMVDCSKIFFVNSMVDSFEISFLNYKQWQESRKKPKHWTPSAACVWWHKGWKKYSTKHEQLKKSYKEHKCAQTHDFIAKPTPVQQSFVRLSVGQHGWLLWVALS